MKIFLSYPLALSLLFFSCTATTQDTTEMRNRQEVLEERLIKLESLQFDLSQKLNSPQQKEPEKKPDTQSNFSKTNAEDIRVLRNDFLAVTNDQESQQKKIAELQETTGLLTKRLSLLEIEIDTLRASLVKSDTSGQEKNTAGSDEELVLFKDASDKFDSQNFEHSQRLFKSYIQKFPSGRYLDRSYYQSGQISFAKGDYRSTSTDLWEVVRRFPKSPIFEDAQWLLAVSLERSNEESQAKEIYKQIADSNGKHSKKADLRLQILSR